MALGILSRLDTAEERITQLYRTESTLDTIRGQMIRLSISGFLACCIGGAVGGILYVAIYYTGELSQRYLEFFAPVGVLFTMFWKDYGPD
ncbi:hypothetical protein [Halorubrum sp. Boch-26]|uniref:hypothetical protein n=1 Tax=Halorubrum sp. Boch-26 TaxID=2994426 RepID=UPI0024685BC0|nr:hypothetical protein [Halorubrum sp. Boch-26]